MENKEKYLAPDLTVVSFKLERGFQASTTQEANRLFELFQGTTATQGYDDQNKQSWYGGQNGEGVSLGDGWDRWQ